VIVHETQPVLVWADIDVGVIPVVRRLNEIPGVRTHASCESARQLFSNALQGEYKPEVMASWTDDAWLILLKEFDITLLGNNFGYLHPITL